MGIELPDDRYQHATAETIHGALDRLADKVAGKEVEPHDYEPKLPKKRQL